MASVLRASQSIFRRSSGKPTAVEVGRSLAEFYGRQAPWEEVRPFIECLFRLSPDATRASPGDFSAE
ncbi:hypothetical protein ACG0Z6_16350 [Roseateles sp. BYS180W]|uniref:Uncharacterized protein n=1 Tax=Roseateles rivi TaxID=3299028 RepID=A0ABW7FZR6_9BURK